MLYFLYYLLSFLLEYNSNMNLEEAQTIYKEWKNFLEIADKLNTIFFGKLPPSFLPYPPEIIESALNTIIEYKTKSGEEREIKLIKETASFYLTPYYFDFNNKSEEPIVSDEKSLIDMKKSLEMILDNDELKKTILEKLQEKQQSWIKSRQRND